MDRWVISTAKIDGPVISAAKVAGPVVECYSRFLHTPVEKRTGGKLQAQDDQVKTPLDMSEHNLVLGK